MAITPHEVPLTGSTYATLCCLVQFTQDIAHRLNKINSVYSNVLQCPSIIYGLNSFHMTDSLTPWSLHGEYITCTFRLCGGTMRTSPNIPYIHVHVCTCSPHTLAIPCMCTCISFDLFPNDWDWVTRLLSGVRVVLKPVTDCFEGFISSLPRTEHDDTLYIYLCLVKFACQLMNLVLWV